MHFCAFEILPKYLHTTFEIIWTMTAKSEVLSKRKQIVSKWVLTEKRLDKCCNFKTVFFSFLHMHMSLQSKCFTFESKKTKFTHISRMHFRTKSWNTFSSELSHLTFTFLSTISQKHFWKNDKKCKHFTWYFKNLCQYFSKELMHSNCLPNELFEQAEYVH